MTWGMVAVGGASLVGGMLSGNAAADSAEKQGQMSAEQAAKLAEAAKWKVTGTTNRYGTSAMKTDPTSGDLTGASWELSPEMKARQAQFMAQSASALPANFNPAQATEAQYQLLKNQQAPGVERGYSGLLSNLMGKGTLGLATGGTEGIGGSTAMRQANPQMEAFMNTVAQQDASNLTSAQSQVRSMMDSDIARSNGLMGQADAIDAKGDSYLDRVMRWSADQRDAALRGAGSVAQQSNLASQQTANADSGSMWGSVLQGLGSNQNLASGIGGMFSPGASPTASAAGGLRAPTGGFW